MLTRRGGRSFPLAACALLLLAGLPAASQEPDEAPVAANTPLLPLDGAGADAPADLPLTVSLGLAWRDPTGLKALLRDLHDPASPRYRWWVSPAEFVARFGPSDDDLEAARAFLEAQGFAVRQPTARHVVGHGTAAMAERAFQVNIEEGTRHGQRVHRNDRDPMLPAGLAARVVHVGGLENITAPQRSLVPLGPTMQPNVASIGVLGRDVAAAYGAAALRAEGFLGAPGAEVAIASWGTLAMDDLNGALGWQGSPAFAGGAAGPGTISATCVPGAGAGDGCSVTELETTLDAVEVAAMASDVHIGLYLARSTTVSAFGVMYHYLADRADTVRIVSHSWGLCLPLMPASVVADDEAAFAMAAAAGQAWFVASGDHGSSDCEAFGITDRAVSYPAASPHVTAVGGTWLQPVYGSDGFLQGWAGETGCSEGGGGAADRAPSGTAGLFARPGWQWGPGIVNRSSPSRILPDTALHYGVCGNTPSAAWAPYILRYQGSAVSVGGTSAAAPAWAGMWAIASDVADADLGPAAPLLHRVLRGEGGWDGDLALRDITAGSNGAYRAKAGHDAVAGVGTPDLAYVAPALQRLAHGFRAAIGAPAAAATAPRGAEVGFADASTGGDGCAPSAWAWDFGDGARSTEPNPTHAFATAGTFTVTLEATGACGAWDRASAVVRVANAAPTASLAVGPAPLRAGNLTLDASASSDPDGGIAGYRFVLDGRRLPEQADPVLDVVVPRAGRHVARVVAVDADGAVSSAASATFQVGLANLTSLRVVPAAARVVAGGAVAFRALGADAFRNRGAAAPDWSATCGTIGADGRFAAPAEAGACTVTATQDGLAVQVQVTVVPGPLATLAIAGPASVAPGTQTSFTAAGEDASGNDVPARLRWSASCGRMDRAGVFTAPSAPGTCVLTARSGRVTATVGVEVA